MLSRVCLESSEVRGTVNNCFLFREISSRFNHRALRYARYARPMRTCRVNIHDRAVSLR
jgi:hypothetical protein